jgi:hypothetical protein
MSEIRKEKKKGIMGALAPNLKTNEGDGCRFLY